MCTGWVILFSDYNKVPIKGLKGPKACPERILETSEPIFMIQKPTGSFLAMDVHWLGRFALRPQQGAHKEPIRP